MDSHPISDTHPVDARMQNLRPSDAINLGFAIYMQGAAETENPAQAELCKRISGGYFKLVDEFPLGTQEGLFLNRFLQAANSFSSGLRRQRRHLADKMEGAKARRELAIERRILVVTHSGMLRGAIHLIVVGGFIFALSKFVIDSTVASTNSHIWASFSSSFGAMLLMIAYQISRMAYSQQNIDNEYHAAIALAREEQVKGLNEELELALTIASEAFTHLMGESPPNDDGYLLSLRSVMSLHGPGAKAEAVEGLMVVGKRMISRGWTYLRTKRAALQHAAESAQKVS